MAKKLAENEEVNNVELPDDVDEEEIDEEAQLIYKIKEGIDKPRLVRLVAALLDLFLVCYGAVLFCGDNDGIGIFFSVFLGGGHSILVCLTLCAIGIAIV